MGLEEFRTVNNSDDSDEVINNDDSQEDNQQMELEKHKDIDNFDEASVSDINDSINDWITDKGFIDRSSNESLEHYKTKSVVALQLNRLGYKVAAEHPVDDEVSNKRADVYAKLKDDEKGLELDTLSINKIEDVIVEVGGYTADRAIESSPHVDCIIWVPKGSEISDGLFILNLEVGDSITVLSDIVEHKADISDEVPQAIKQVNIDEQIDNHSFIDENGNKFAPKVDELYIRKYRKISKDILYEFNDATEFTIKDIEDSIELDDYTVSDEDISVVLSALGFTE